MSIWQLSPWHLLGVARSFYRWLRLMARLGAAPERGVFESAHTFLQEREAWVAIMNTIQFHEGGSFEVLDGLARRHGSVLSGASIPDEGLLRQLSPLVWFFYSQKERFPEHTVGHGCAVGVLHALFRAAHTGASRDDVLAAVRLELDAQMTDACRWGEHSGAPGGGWEC